MSRSLPLRSLIRAIRLMHLPSVKKACWQSPLLLASAFALIGGTGSIQPVEAGSINVDAVSEYTTKKKSSRAQVTSVTQFSDVYPTDWAYQALSNLVERYGCVAGYPNGTCLLYTSDAADD